MHRLCRYVDWVTLTYISCSIDFYTFYVTLPYVLNCKAFNHQTLYSTSSWCTDSAGILTWWPWPILCTPVTLTHFMLMFGISSDIRPTTTKPCIVLFLNVRTAGTLTGWPWPIFCTSLTSTLFYVALPYVLNCKAFNHQILYNATSRCTDLAVTLNW